MLGSKNILEAKTTEIIGIALTSIVVIAFSGNALGSLDRCATDAGEDRFEITQIYPTKDTGREWFVNMDDLEDRIFDPRTGIDQRRDWSWRVSREDNDKNQVRMNVYTPEGEEEWQNVEIIGAMQKSSIPWVMCQMMTSTFYNVLQWCA